MQTDNPFQVVGIKHYVNTFGINEKTASIWYHDDLQMLNRRRLTLQQFNFIYADVKPFSFQIPPKKQPKKHQKITKKRLSASK